MQSKEAQRKQPLLPYSLSTKWKVGAAVLAKERERKVKRGVKYCQKMENYKVNW